MSGPEFDALMAKEHVRLGELIKKRGIKMAA